MGKLVEICIAMLRKFSIRTRIIAALIISLFVFCFTVLLLSNMFSRKIINSYVNEYVNSTQEEIVSSVQMIMDEINMMTIRLRSNQDIYEIFNDDNLSNIAIEQKTGAVFRNIITNNDVIGDISIIKDRGGKLNCYSYKSRIKEINKPYLTKIEKSVKPVIGSIIGDEEGNYYIPFGVKFRNFYTGEKIGYIIMYIREQAICDIYKRMVPDWGYSFIIENDDSIISHIDKRKLGKIVLDVNSLDTNSEFEYKNMKYEGENTILAVYSFSDGLKNLGINWKLISVIKQKKLFNIIDDVNRYVISIEIILFIAGAFLSIYVSLRVINPVARLRVKMGRFGKGDLNVSPIDTKSGDEIWELENTFNKMVLDIKDLILRNNVEKEKQREMELTALQAQINPHFLYNTLDAIGWIAKLKKQNDIEILVMSLAKFFRLSLHKGEKFITVDEEINLVQSFVQIEQMRSPGKFDITYNIEDSMKSFKMLKIILQPLVENSIKHGIGQKRGKGLIQINGFLSGDEIIFEVIDDGIGFDMNSVDLVKSERGILRSGYGIRNVDERIKLEYGSEYGLNIESEIGKGTKALIKMRIKQND